MALASVSPTVAGSKPKKLLDQTRDVLRLKHYSLRTERSYCDWIERCDDLRRPAVWLRECGFVDSDAVREASGQGLLLILIHRSNNGGQCDGTNDHLEKNISDCR